MRLVAGNWKMNGARQLVSGLIGGLAQRMSDAPPRCGVVVCPPAHLLEAAAAVAAGQVLIGAQDCSDEARPGAFTGELSAAMLAEAGCRYVIVGHSERRQRHRESDGLVQAKASRALEAGLVPIICVGETLDEREAGNAVARVTGQVRGSLPAEAKAGAVVVAYEPVWAIGTGRTASPEKTSLGCMRHIREAWEKRFSGDLRRRPARCYMAARSRPSNAARHSRSIEQVSTVRWSAGASLIARRVLGHR